MHALKKKFLNMKILPILEIKLALQEGSVGKEHGDFQLLVHGDLGTTPSDSKGHIDLVLKLVCLEACVLETLKTLFTLFL